MSPNPDLGTIEIALSCCVIPIMFLFVIVIARLKGKKPLG